MRPYNQGELDGLCGVYSLINATRLITKRMSFADWQLIFLKMLKLQLKQRKSANFLVYGINEVKIAKLLRQIFKPQFGISYSRPFQRRKQLELSDFWAKLEAYLHNGNNRCVIICYSTEHFSHWSVVQAISPNRLVLLDSSHRKYINRNACSTEEIDDGKAFLLEFSATFFLEGK